MLTPVELARADALFPVPRQFARRSFGAFLGMAAALAGSACGSDSELGACGYGAKLDTRYACEGNVQVTTRDKKQLDQAQKIVQETAADIRAGEFSPRRGFVCRGCAYRPICPAHEESLST